MSWNTTHRFTFMVSWCFVAARCPVKIGRFVHRRCFHTCCGAPGWVSWSRCMFSQVFVGWRCWNLNLWSICFADFFWIMRNDSRNQQPCNFRILCTPLLGYICLRLVISWQVVLLRQICAFFLFHYSALARTSSYQERVKKDRCQAETLPDNLRWI